MLTSDVELNTCGCWVQNNLKIK